MSRVSEYWRRLGKAEVDKRPGGRTFTRSDGSLGCAECCNGDRCDDPSHFHRDSCPFCLGTGEPASEPGATMTPDERCDAITGAMMQNLRDASARAAGEPAPAASPQGGETRESEVPK
jgi:hypothetical protein